VPKKTAVSYCITQPGSTLEWIVSLVQERACLAAGVRVDQMHGTGLRSSYIITGEENPVTEIVWTTYITGGERFEIVLLGHREAKKRSIGSGQQCLLLGMYE